jgi:predicted Zn-dependent peptidase
MSGDDVAEAVQRLAELRDKALITPEEFEAKKQELLGRL